VLAIIAGVAIAGLTYSFLGNPLDPFDDRPFSASEWRLATVDDRAPMARSAVRRHLIQGLPDSQVVALLGDPDEVRTARDPGGNTLQGAQTYLYYLGSWSDYGFDDAFLYVHLDATGRVRSAEVNGY
jgi:hypothetical protein